MQPFDIQSGSIWQGSHYDVMIIQYDDVIGQHDGIVMIGQYTKQAMGHIVFLA